MERTVSSALTPLWKFLLPLYFAGFTAAFTYALIARPDRIEGGRWWGSEVGALVLWLLTAGVIRKAARLRRVRLDDTGVVVCNYIREARIPWSALTGVFLEGGRRSPPVITISFQDATPLGAQAEFIPARFRDVDALVVELRTRGGLVSAHYHEAQ